MASACIRRYQPIVIDGEQKILHSRVGDTWQLKDPKDGLITSVSQVALLKKYEAGNVLFLINNKLSTEIAKELYKSQPKGKPDDVEEYEWDLATAKVSLVKAVCGLGWQSVVQKEEIQTLWPKLTAKLKFVPLIPDASTVYRWWVRLEEYGWDGRALLPQHWKKGRKPEEINSIQLQLIEEGVEDEYLTMERKPRGEAYKAICILVDTWNDANKNLAPLVYPKQCQVFRYIKELDAFDTYAARYGHQTAIRKFRSVQGATVASEPLERVELDHTVLDVIVLDDETLLPLGRPTIAIALDVFTRCVVGIYIGFEPPSVSTVGQCVRSALTPKLGLLESIPQIQGPWSCYGMMQTLAIDHALENFSGMIGRMAFCLNIEVLWCGRKMPWKKGSVERFIGTLNRGFCHQIEGTTRSNIVDKGDYDAVGRAVCSNSALRNGLIKWVVDNYHTKFHRTLQMAPVGRWQTSIREDDIPLCTDLTSIDASLRVPKKKPLTHKGVDCNSGLLYNSDELSDLRRQYGAELEVLAYPSPSNLKDIIVEHEASAQRFTVPCLNMSYANGMTLWQHKAIRKHARNEGIGCATFAEQLKCKSSLEAIIYEGMAESPLKERVRAARMLQRTRDENEYGNYAPTLPTSTQVNSADKRAVEFNVDDEAESSCDVEMEVH